VSITGFEDPIFRVINHVPFVVCLQPFIYDQQEKNKHKFMVQSVLAPVDADLTDLNKLVSRKTNNPNDRNNFVGKLKTSTILFRLLKIMIYWPFLDCILN